MTRPAIEVADIVRAKGRQFLERFKAILSYQELKAYRAVERCRTAALGDIRTSVSVAVTKPASPITRVDRAAVPSARPRLVRNGSRHSSAICSTPNYFQR